MSPVIIAAIIGATGAIVGSVLTLRAAREAERTKVRALQTTSEIEALKLQMAGWPPLVEALRAEIDRLTAQLAEARKPARTAAAKAPAKRTTRKRGGAA